MTAVAHELGHATTFHAMRKSTNRPPWDCDFSHTWAKVMDCENIASHEAYADFWAVAWGYAKTATSPRFGGSGGTAVEAVVATCTTAGSGWLQEGCIASALWDIYDRRVVGGTDDDPIDQNQTSITVEDFVSAFGGLPYTTPGCDARPDRCVAEDQRNANNHWDFKYGFFCGLDDNGIGGQLIGQVQSIFIQDGISGGGEEPFLPQQGCGIP